MLVCEICDSYISGASGMSNLATTYSALGRHEDALALFEKALDIKQRCLPGDDPDICE